ncbi:hypothetical protein MMC07_002540 [Pseudocyphellaria aurata]|nr:hypothetical protein [Pseudocyphellaria aurata]
MFLIIPATTLALLIGLASCQNFISTTLPTCAQQCALLQQAQTICIPPAAPVTNQDIYQSCFCESNLLKPLAATPAQVCPACSPAELGTLQSWFAGFCTPAAGAQPTTLSTSTSSIPTPTTSVPTAAPPGPTPPSTAGSSTISDKAPPDNRDWIHSHWRWVLMLIILFLGFGILAWAGWYLHRRYHRRHDGEAMTTSAASVTRQPDLETWGPGQSVHDFGAVGGVVRPQMDEKGKGNDRSDAVLQQQRQQPPPQPLPEQNPEEKKGSRRLKKVLLGGRG